MSSVITCMPCYCYHHPNWHLGSSKINKKFSRQLLAWARGRLHFVRPQSDIWGSFKPFQGKANGKVRDGTSTFWYEYLLALKRGTGQSMQIPCLYIDVFPSYKPRFSSQISPVSLAWRIDAYLNGNHRVDVIWDDICLGMFHNYPWHPIQNNIWTSEA